MRAYLRPLLVLGALHRRLLERIAARNYDVALAAHRTRPDREALGRVARGARRAALTLPSVTG